MNPTLTKASEALHESLSDWQGNGDLHTFAVIAVLKAIREPDDDAIDAGAKAYNAPSGYEHETAIDASRCWRAMIDSITNCNTTANHGSRE